jgi:hypothetical protein
MDVYNYGFTELCHFVERTLGLVALKTTGGLLAKSLLGKTPPGLDGCEARPGRVGGELP